MLQSVTALKSLVESLIVIGVSAFTKIAPVGWGRCMDHHGSISHQIAYIGHDMATAIQVLFGHATQMVLKFVAKHFALARLWF